MKRTLTIGAVLCLCAFAAHAGPPQVTQGSTNRIGGPLKPWKFARDRQPGPAANPLVLDASLPKQFFDAGEPIVLTVTFVDGTVTVSDEYTRNEVDDPKAPQVIKATAKGRNTYVATLDMSPGKHTLTIDGDAVFNGRPLRGHDSQVYTVATGAVRITDVGKVRSDGATIAVPLLITSTKGAYVNITGTLVAGNTEVARADVGAQIDVGASSIDLTFRQADLVEPGPYRLTKVMAMVPAPTGGADLAAAVENVGHPFNIAGGGHGKEPQPPTDQFGAHAFLNTIWFLFVIYAAIAAGLAAYRVWVERRRSRRRRCGRGVVR